MRVVGYHIGEGMIASTDNGVVPSPPLEYLLLPKKDSIRILLHLDYSMANLLRFIGVSKKEGEELLLTTNLRISPYKIRYIPGKLFSIKRARAFSYFSDASQYTQLDNTLLSNSPQELADKAKEIGEEVCKVLSDLGFQATSLVNPIKAYEKTPPKTLPLQQINWLYKEMETSGMVKKNVIHKLIQGLVEGEEKKLKGGGLEPITLSTAIKKNRWSQLGKLV